MVEWSGKVGGAVADAGRELFLLCRCLFTRAAVSVVVEAAGRMVWGRGTRVRCRQEWFSVPIVWTFENY